ncbi:hypothetical protein U8V72_22380 [Priestia filamentosa]|uniref:hypothetical protein n=1 Tax=Priestia filamentosa TaxID=1402861 RepID=UPI0005892904
MHKKIKELYETLPGERKELAKLTEHFLEALRNIEEQHRLTVASDALAGIKPNKDEEIAFKDTLKSVRQMLIIELEKTVQDLEHQGDKHWVKNFKDGII